MKHQARNKGQEAKSRKQDPFHISSVIVAFVLVLASCILHPVSFAQTPAPTDTPTPVPGDAYEPDDAPGADPPWIGEGETQNRTFDPEGDVDKARLYVKAGHWYEVQTQDLGRLVDTVLIIEVGDTIYQDDDSSPESLASRIVFQAPATSNVTVTITNSQEIYGPEQTYELYAGETAAPTPIPTNTPKPTKEPPPTATPAKPIINFSATPDHVTQPGECATLRWSVDRASEVFLVLPNGNQEGVEGLGERQVCPLETSEYLLKVNAPGGNETVRVQVTVPLPTQTPTPKPKPAGGSGAKPTGKATLHIVVFVDNNDNGAYDPDEGVSGALVYLRSQANPDQLTTRPTDTQGQTHFENTAAGSYAVLIPHLGRAEVVSFRGEELTVSILVPALRLPSRIP